MTDPKFAAREPKPFVKFFKELEPDKSVVLYFAGMKGLAAEVTERDDKPKHTEYELRVTRDGLVTVIKVLACLFQRRPVKFVPDKKSWNVYIGPRP